MIIANSKLKDISEGSSGDGDLLDELTYNNGIFKIG